MRWLRKRKLKSRYQPLWYNSPSGPCSVVALTVQIVAATPQEARHAAELMSLGPQEWRFVSNEMNLRGVHGGMAVFYGNWFERKDAAQIERTARANAMDVWMIDAEFPGLQRA